MYYYTVDGPGNSSIACGHQGIELSISYMLLTVAFRLMMFAWEIENQHTMMVIHYLIT